MLGCELCKLLIEKDVSYDVEKRVPQTTSNLLLTGKRPNWYPPLSKRLFFKIKADNPNGNPCNFEISIGRNEKKCPLSCMTKSEPFFRILFSVFSIDGTSFEGSYGTFG